MKPLNFLLATVALFASGSGVAAADACPEGTITNPTGAGGQPQCVPGVNHQNWGGSGSSSEPHWARRWGAFATDAATSKVGVATGLSSKRKAEKEALAHCQSKGGAQCKPLIAYYDQCAALAWGPNSAGVGNMVSATAAHVEEAQTLALKECSKDSQECKIYFAECSYAERTN